MKKCHLIPDEEKQCVWMTAGLITYKLCTFEYCCEECVFDKVMRNETATTIFTGDCEASQSDTPVIPNPFLQRDESLFYHECHCWAKVEDPDTVRIGIDGILARLVGKIKTVVLPNQNEEIKQGQCFSHLIHERHVVPLISPLSGVVLKVNNELKKHPEFVGYDPWAGGYYR